MGGRVVSVGRGRSLSEEDGENLLRHALRVAVEKVRELAADLEGATANLA